MDKMTNLDPDTPHSPERTREIADLAADAIRMLNYATLPGRGGLHYPGDVFELLGALADLAARLPQLHRQIGAWLAEEQRAGHLAEPASGPNEGSVPLAVMRAMDALVLADGFAGDLRSALRNAQSSIRAVEFVGADDTADDSLTEWQADEQRAVAAADDEYDLGGEG